MRRRFGARGFLRKSARTPASVAAPMLADLTRNAVDVLPEGGLEAKLALGRPLRVKLGIDVTSPDIHVGRAIPLQRMRAFQDAGHVPYVGHRDIIVTQMRNFLYWTMDV